MAGKFVCVSSDEDLKERVELPDRVVLVNNGAFDLEQKGLSGFYVWIGYRHDDSGSSEISMKSVLQKTTHSVGKWLQEYAGTKYEVDDFWKDLEMYRVWAGGENMDVDRKKKDEATNNDFEARRCGEILPSDIEKSFKAVRSRSGKPAVSDVVKDLFYIYPEYEQYWNKNPMQQKKFYTRVRNWMVKNYRHDWFVDESIEIRKECRIPGTDIVLEAGDMISVVSKQNEAYGDDYQKLLHGILDLVERYGLHRKYKDRDLDRIIMDAAEEASIRAMDL